MPQVDIGSADSSDIQYEYEDYAVDSEQLDGAKEVEFKYSITDWPQWLGYYKSIPELQAAIDAKANWTIGAGFTADEITTMMLMTFRGNGKDCFNDIICNMVRTYTIAGDAFAEIIRDPDSKVLANIKPLDPSTITIVYNSKGVIVRYEQREKTKKGVISFRPDQILHLSRKRLADEIHGVSVIPAVEWIILARNEAMNDWKRVLHRNVEPMWVFHLDTDDTTQIANFKAKMDEARGNGENMYIPKGAVVPELISTAQNAGLNPLTWINQLNDYFFQAVNMPQIIVGNAKEFTDASAKIVYLSYEQAVKAEQLYVEQQILAQLNIVIELTFPASLQNDTISTSPDQMRLQNEPLQKAGEPANTRQRGGL